MEFIVSYFRDPGIFKGKNIIVTEYAKWGGPARWTYFSNNSTHTKQRLGNLDVLISKYNGGTDYYYIQAYTPAEAVLKVENYLKISNEQEYKSELRNLVKEAVDQIMNSATENIKAGLKNRGYSVKQINNSCYHVFLRVSKKEVGFTISMLRDSYNISINSIWGISRGNDNKASCNYLHSLKDLFYIIDTCIEPELNSAQIPKGLKHAILRAKTMDEIKNLVKKATLNEQS